MAAKRHSAEEAAARESESGSVADTAVSEAERVSLRPYAAAVRRLSGLMTEALSGPDVLSAGAEHPRITFSAAPSSAAAPLQQRTVRPRGTATSQVAAALARLKSLDDRLHATTEIFDSSSVEAARRMDAAGERKVRPLRGLPVIVKDVMDVAGSATRANCRALGDRPTAQDAAVVSRLRSAGGIVIAKAVSWELSFAETDDATALHPRAVNPWSSRHDTGGSSSGVAAAIAAAACPAGLASDTGGSARGPAAWCGIVGFKPTTGLLPTAGMLPLSPSFDCPAVMAEDVETCRQIFAIQAGAAAAAHSGAAPGSLRVAIWRDAYGSGSAAPADANVAAQVEAAVARLAALGVEVVEAQLPPLELYSAAFVALARRETFATWRSLLDGEPALLGGTLRERLRACSLFDEALLVQAHQVKARLNPATQQALAKVDAIVLPTMPTPAPLTTGAAGPMAFDKPAYVRFASLLGLPSISMPCGLTAGGLPIGLMLNGRQGEDHRLLAIAALIEQVCPPLGAPMAPGQEG